MQTPNRTTEVANRIAEIDKKVSQRSAAYPFITIEKALAFVTQLKGTFQNSSFNRADVSKILNKSEIVKRDISASVQYGLLEKTVREGYKISQTAHHIITPITEEEKQDNIVECFKKPKLYSELIEKYQGQILPQDAQLQAILVRFHNITDSAAPQAVEVFIQNALFAGLLNKQRILKSTSSNEITATSKKAELLAPIDSIETSPSREADSSPNMTPNQKATKEDVTQALALEDINGKVEIVIRLTEKKIARLVYPDGINEKDIQILKLQLEQLALTL